MARRGKRNKLVDVLAIAFGIGAWVSINGLWVESPLLVQTLPEGWNLPSFMSIIIQISNIGPISYTLLRFIRPNLQSTPIIYSVLSMGCVASLLLALFWSSTTVIEGNERSTALLSLMFFLGLVDCTSSVLYIPYMAAWREIYLPSYLIGEGLSGLLPALVALGQGVGNEPQCENITFYNETIRKDVIIQEQQELQPNFSVEIFFLILFGMMIVSTLGFVLLEHFPRIQEERSSNYDLKMTGKETEDNGSTSEEPTSWMNKNTFLLLMIILCWSCFLANGLLPSIQSYSCGPFGTVPYHLAATLSALANPVAAYCTMILSRASTRVISLLCGVGTVIAMYIIATAAMSPTPPLVDYTSGGFIIVLVWVSFSGLISYVRVEITNLMWARGSQSLFWAGAITQAGSAIGAVVAFVLVNNSSIFKSIDPCA